jgi:phosphoinositide-3-kinase regulatory subunit 4
MINFKISSFQFSSSSLFQQNDRSIILARPYIKDNLFHRLQTRPYLTRMEKKWIAFQLLIALKHIHNVHIAHGDLKIENILLTSYNWVLLSDFANFKPTFFAYVKNKKKNKI